MRNYKVSFKISSVITLSALEGRRGGYIVSFVICWTREPHLQFSYEIQFNNALFSFVQRSSVQMRTDASAVFKFSMSEYHLW